MAHSNKRTILSTLIAILAVSGCANTHVTPLSANTVLISTSVEPDCGEQSAEKIAFSRAAVETIRRGFDQFVIVGAQGSSNVYQVGNMPVYADTTATARQMGGSVFINGQTRLYGGQPIYGGSHNRQLEVVMFRAGDPQTANALDARIELGPDWQKKIKENKNICF
jgi:hypothetical protein